jgi:transposase
MMLGQGGPVKVFVATRPVDFRKGIDGLALAVQEMLGLDPFCGAVFVFRAKRADRIKLLVWDQTGMVLVHKRLEGGKFVWPQVRDGVMRCPRRSWRRSSRGWTGGWSGPNGRGVLWRRDERAPAREAPVLAGHAGGFVIHFRAWTPTLSAARTPI